MENVSENFNSAQKTGNQKMFLLVFAPDSVCVCKSQKSSDKKIHDDWFILQRATFLWWRRGLQTKKFCT